jgi:hypothetical protein
MCRLLSDAEPAEYPPQDFIRRNLAGDLAEMIKGRVYVNGYQVGGKTFAQAGTDAGNGIECGTQGLVVPGVGNQGAVAGFGLLHKINQVLRQQVDILPALA